MLAGSSSRSGAWRWCVVLVHLLLLLLCASATSGHQQQGVPHSDHRSHPQQGVHHSDRRDHLQRLFSALDTNHDGELQQRELTRAVGASLSGEAGRQQRGVVEASVAQSIQRLDSPDAGLGVSSAELEAHLHTLLQDVKVADWVAHGLGLPQYAAAFSSNAITALDFPMLVNDGGVLLQTELGVHSQLHRHKLLGAMQRQVLGLGTPPGPLQPLKCSTTAAHGAAGRPAPAQHAVACSWAPPEQQGQPRVHSYVLQRLHASHAAAEWVTVAQLPDGLTTRYTDSLQQPGEYSYRVAAWNVYGRSPYAVSADVRVSARGGAREAAPGPEGPECAASGQARSVRGGADAGGPAGRMQRQQQEQDDTACAAGNQAGCGSSSCAAPRAALTAADASAAAAAAAAAAATGGARAAGGAAASATARAAALLAGMWRSSSSGGSWVRAALDSCLLLLLPVCVRLLPISVLDAAANQLAQLLQLLPSCCRRWVVRQHDARMRACSPTQLVPDPVPAAVSDGSSAGRLEAPPSTLAAQRSSSSGGSNGLVPAGGSSLAAAERSSRSSAAGAGIRSSSASDISSSSLQQQMIDVAGVRQAVLAALCTASAAVVGSRPGTPGQQQLQQAAAPSSCGDALLPAANASSAAQAPALGTQAAADVSSPAAAAPSSQQQQQQQQQQAGAGGVAAVVAGAAAAGRVGGVARSRSAMDLVPHPAPPAGAATQRRSSCAGAGAGSPSAPSAPSAAAAAAAAATAQAGALGRVPHAWLCSANEQQQQPGELWLQPAQLHSVLFAEQHELVSNKRCGFPGCQQAFDLRHWRATLQRHYCGRCQQAFCAQHTAYSPHGASGACGVQSRCLCLQCFGEYTPEYQAFLASRNTLTSKRSRSGPPLSASAAAAGAAGAAGAGPPGVRVAAASAAGDSRASSWSGGGGSSSSSGGGGGGSARSWRPRSALLLGRRASAGTGAAPLSPLSSQQGDAAARGAADDSDAAAALQRTPSARNTQLLWGRGLTKALGVVRFKHAGSHAHAADEPAAE